ncbi:hypothetical protein Poly30_14400 [Planctomycetes bacterium Poly30]|uniref:ABC-type transport auxiliary lipoprotein component domain-containing protein n=1 Tax=Saltatorellus ferox TaxID=2528018 RepID=A0A518EPB8_9BACT|nr:hypothetical protein Poly30_14400 [Planctomycetes bacterium Poly30]
MKISMPIRFLTCLALGLLPGCLSLTPDAPTPTRWLSPMPQASTPGTNQGGIKTPQPKVPSLRMGTVAASDAITDQLIRRVSEVEILYVDSARWAESPAVVVQRMLEDELFQRQGFVSDAGAERRLDVHVITFEEHLEPRREGWVAVIARLVDGDGRALMHRRFEAHVPVDGEDPALVAEALVTGVKRVVQEISALVALK